MEFLGENSGAALVGGGISSSEQSSALGVLGSSPAYNSGTTDLLRQVEQFMVAAKKEKTAQRQTARLS